MAQYGEAAAGVGAGEGAAAACPQPVKPVPTKISFVADSIGHHVNFAALEKLTKTKILKRKAYGAVKATDAPPNSSITL